MTGLSSNIGCRGVILIACLAAPHKPRFRIRREETGIQAGFDAISKCVYGGDSRKAWKKVTSE